ncbi:signal peptide peptidase SppA [Pleomorphovibrio marinus]|uniref:signal peptide peptidase SppA n=1 Tax=Pleomorphovibrio marinus TaxID=2164132 RepID=UPI000E0BDCB4|nr:signal peptide peptidase SppA [Pleomorphovibrio marinus]
MKFLSNVLAVIVGLLVFWVLGFFILGGIIAVISADEQVKVKENSVLLLDLDRKALVERTVEDDFDLAFLGPFSGVESVGLLQAKRAIETAKENENVKGIFLKAGIFTGGGSAMYKELREALEDFKESGKFVIAYSEIYSESGYYLSSVADEVYMNPMGGLEFNGLAYSMVFLKRMFEKIEVEPVVFRAGDFKDAVEPFINESMSEESKQQTQQYLNDLNMVMVSAVSESRQIPLERVQEINDNMLVRTNQDAVDLGLVDGLWYDDQVVDLIREKLGLEEDEDINSINITRINKTAPSKNRLSKNRIAVVFADGEITSGSSGDGITSEKFMKEIRKLRKNKDIKAIVLRVNSPGGSALASEVIWRELNEAKKEKPLIASMANYAASGGYYLAAPADTILAQPNTITGSIGVFSLWFNAEGLLNNKLGINSDVVKTGEFSDFVSFDRAPTPREKEIFQKQTDEVYEIFLRRVTEGRNMEKESLLPLASGRVWSGKEAKANGLVDVLGGLEDAVSIAAEKAGVAEDYRVVYYPEQKGFLETLISEFSKEVKIAQLRWRYGISGELMLQMEKVKNLKGIMARLPFEFEVR